MPSILSPPPYLLVVVLLTACLDVSRVAAYFDCGDASPSPPASSPLPAPTTNDGGSSSDAAFRANLLTLLGALPRAAAPTGFASLSLGAGRDRAFVRGVCRGDFAPPRCLADLQDAVGKLGESCNNSRRAAIWLDVYVTYADTNVSTPREDDFRQVIYDTRMVADPVGYLRAYGPLMSRLVARAVAGEPGRPAFFATGEARYASGDPNGTMYGMVQCMRDVAAADCDRCLRGLVPRLPCCSGNQGGVVLGYNCFLRIQVYTFYDLALDAPPPADEPPAAAAVPSPTHAGEASGEFECNC
jgi:interleukin-1 receptor-associated kinase 1